MIGNMMLIFDAKLMIFQAFSGSIYFQWTCFLHVFFVVFFDLKIASDDFGVENTNGDFGATRLSVKNRVFSFMMKLQNAKIQKDACIFIVFYDTCKVSKMWKLTSGWCFAAGIHKNWGMSFEWKMYDFLQVFICRQWWGRWVFTKKWWCFYQKWCFFTCVVQRF
jgi:hypothetical protein